MEFFFAGTNFRVRATGREKRENLNLAKITRYTVSHYWHNYKCLTILTAVSLPLISAMAHTRSSACTTILA